MKKTISLLVLAIFILALAPISLAEENNAMKEERDTVKKDVIDKEKREIKEERKPADNGKKITPKDENAIKPRDAVDKKDNQKESPKADRLKEKTEKIEDNKPEVME